jgi:hypothetical protein
MKTESKIKSRLRRTALASLFALGLAVMPSPGHAATHNLDVNVDLGFQGTTAINVGDEVVWSWADQRYSYRLLGFAISPTISPPPGTQIFDTGEQVEPFAFSFIFNDPGLFQYVDFISFGEYSGHISVAGASAVPLPAALPLFGTGLGVMGLFGWWKRRRAVAV